MFTGIVREMGTITENRRTRAGRRLSIEGTIRAEAGGSVAVDGVCLTALEKGRLTFDVVPETLSRTTLGKLAKGDQVNLEPALRAGEAIDGHGVAGHVDGVGRVERMTRRNGVVLRLSVDPAIAARLVSKGSVCVSGVSLTVVEVGVDYFTVALIPFTLKHTTLGNLKRGDRVNIETDHAPGVGITKELLKRTGFLDSLNH